MWTMICGRLSASPILTETEPFSASSGIPEMESTRFSDRMHVVMEVTDDVKATRVPPLILQPILENAVKHGVGATRGMVELVLSAKRKGETVVIRVENDAPRTDIGKLPDGMGIGLRNVADRIAARFPGQAILESGHIAPGRFAVTLILPLELPPEMR